jgi:hypothetical protein
VVKKKSVALAEPEVSAAARARAGAAIRLVRMSRFLDEFLRGGPPQIDKWRRSVDAGARPTGSNRPGEF